MKFTFFCSIFLPPSNHRTFNLLNSNTQLAILPFQELFLTIRCFSSLQPQQDKQSFTIAYLVNNCGLSPKDARSAVKYVFFDNTEKPDSVLRLLRDLGLTDHAPISQVIRKQPQMLLWNVNKTILPKLKFLHSIGFSTNDLHKSICRNPRFFGRSLERCFIPFYDILKKSLLQSDRQAVAIMKVLAGRQVANAHTVNVNISVLRGIGMPQSVISAFVRRCPFAICNAVAKFSGAVKQVVEMGFDPERCMFNVALEAKLQMSTSTWKCKIDAYAKWGLSEDEIISAFRRHPCCMRFSAESIREKMEFLVNKTGLQPVAVLKYPTILTCSLEKRIVPRCSVIGVLFLKGLIKPKIKLSRILLSTDNRFLANYVMEHKEQVSELLDIVQGKKGVEELGFGFGEIRGALFT